MTSEIKTSFKNRWEALSLSGQLANIGSEMNRALHFQELKDEESRKNSLIRIFDLISLSLADPKWKSHLKELTRLKEVASAMFVKHNDYFVSVKTIRDYFLAFALAARKNK